MEQLYSGSAVSDGGSTVEQLYNHTWSKFGRYPILPIDMCFNAANNASVIDNITTVDKIRDFTK